MLSYIRLKNFRSYKEASFEFNDGVNIIVGPNASGKTNLLEAILVSARGSSYRVADQDLIMFNKPWLRIDAALDSGEQRVVKIKRVGDKSSKSYAVNDKPYARLPRQHSWPTVLFEPSHLLMLLNGQPEARRQYLDDILEQLKPSYGPTRRHYKRVLAQRNALLKRNPTELKQQLFVWNVRLSELGGFIAKERDNLTKELNEQISSLYKDIAHSRTKVTASYHTALPIESYETALLRQLETVLERDLQRGFTSVGPHRDDLNIMFDGVAAAESASRGEIRTAILALKIFELKVLEKELEQKPLLLLDDVFSELDGKRRHALTDHLQKYQTFITTTDADVVSKNFSQRANIILPK